MNNQPTVNVEDPIEAAIRRVEERMTPPKLSDVADLKLRRPAGNRKVIYWDFR